MVATVTITERNTVSEVSTDKTGGAIRFKAADDPNVDLNDPIVVPAENQVYSFEKWLKVNIATGTGFTQITDIVAYTDGNNEFGAGVKLWGILDSIFSTPVQPDAQFDPPRHDGSNMFDMFNYTQQSPLSLESGPVTTPGDILSFLILVLEVEAGANPGVVQGESLIISYDEI